MLGSCCCSCNINETFLYDLLLSIVAHCMVRLFRQRLLAMLDGFVSASRPRWEKSKALVQDTWYCADYWLTIVQILPPYNRFYQALQRMWAMWQKEAQRNHLATSGLLLSSSRSSHLVHDVEKLEWPQLCAGFLVLYHFIRRCQFLLIGNAHTQNRNRDFVGDQCWQHYNQILLKRHSIQENPTDLFLMTWILIVQVIAHTLAWYRHCANGSNAKQCTPALSGTAMLSYECCHGPQI